MFALVLLAAGADPAPRFEVVNRMAPTFTVTNRVPAAATPAGWRHWTDASGKTWLVKDAAPEVAAPRPFRGAGPQHDSDHTCDKCGATQYVISGRGPVPGSHTHTCARCGNVWWH